MINLIESPQESNLKIYYEAKKGVLTATLDGISETFDFTELQDGITHEIIVEKLPLNPILKAEKVGDIINIEVLRFYSFEEKELFEIGYNNMEN